MSDIVVGTKGKQNKTGELQETVHAHKELKILRDSKHTGTHTHIYTNGFVNKRIDKSILNSFGTENVFQRNWRKKGDQCGVKLYKKLLY